MILGLFISICSSKCYRCIKCIIKHTTSTSTVQYFIMLKINTPTPESVYVPRVLHNFLIRFGLTRRFFFLLTMRDFISTSLLLLLIGVASAFFRPAIPFQLDNPAPLVNSELFGLDNPGKFCSEWIGCFQFAGVGGVSSPFHVLSFLVLLSDWRWYEHLARQKVRILLWMSRADKLRTFSSLSHV